MRFDIVLVDDFEEHVHDLTFDIGAHDHKLAIDSVQNSFEIVALSRVLAVKQLKEAIDEVVADVLCDHVWAKMDSKDEFKKQFVDELQVGPGFLEVRFILIRVHRR